MRGAGIYGRLYKKCISVAVIGLRKYVVCEFCVFRVKMVTYWKRIVCLHVCVLRLPDQLNDFVRNCVQEVEAQVRVRSINLMRT